MNRTSKTSRLIPVAKIGRPHGVQGAAKVYPYGESLAAQAVGSKIFLQSDSKSELSELTIASLRPQQRMLVVEFKELTSRDDVLEISGAEILLSEDRLPPPAEGEYYHYQLIGLIVETLQGSRIGTLSRIIETGGADVYSIDFGGKEILIPAVDGVIVEIDLELGKIIVDPPEGLMDDL